MAKTTPERNPTARAHGAAATRGTRPKAQTSVRDEDRAHPRIDPRTASAADILVLQRQIGNRATTRLLDSFRGSAPGPEAGVRSGAAGQGLIQRASFFIGDERFKTQDMTYEELREQVDGVRGSNDADGKKSLKEALEAEAKKLTKGSQVTTDEIKALLVRLNSGPALEAEVEEEGLEGAPEPAVVVAEAPAPLPPRPAAIVAGKAAAYREHYNKKRQEGFFTAMFGHQVPTYKEDAGGQVLALLNAGIAEGKYAYLGISTVKKGQEKVHVYADAKYLIIVKLNGEFQSIFERGRGIAAAVEEYLERPQ